MIRDGTSLPSASAASPIVLETVDNEDQGTNGGIDGEVHRDVASLSSWTALDQGYSAISDRDCFMELPFCAEKLSWCDTPSCSNLSTSTSSNSFLFNGNLQRKNNQRKAFLPPLFSQRNVSQRASPNPTEATDKVLSAELKRLTIHEREKVTEDIHGIGAVIEETPDFVRQKIEEFDHEVMRLRKRHARISTSNYTMAYEKALFLNPRLVQDDVDFKLMFLRGDCFDAEKSANRYMLYFDTKLELFGWDKLVKQPITQNDLTEEERNIMSRGGIQPLPLKDRAGRRVMMIFPKHDMGVTKSHFRVQWYLMMASIENDPDVQRRGTVDVFYFIGGDTSMIPTPNPENIQLPKKCMDSVPRRVVGMHALYDDPRMGPLMFIIPLLVSKAKMIRFRSHYGSRLEGSYALKTFGIAAENLPVDRMTGCFLDNSWFNDNYLKERNRMEEQLERRQTGIIPTGRDCLLGRGRPFQDWHGNLRVAALIDQHRADFAKAGSAYGKKTIVCDTIVDLIHRYGGRFLKLKTGDPRDGWELADSDKAREKVSHGFRVKRTSRNGSLSSKLGEIHI